MANVVKHRFLSAKTDGADLTQVQPSHWNDGHLFTGGAAGDLLMRDPTDPTFGAAWHPRGASKYIINGDSGAQSNWAPAGFDSATSVIYWNGTAPATIHGLAGGINGQVVTIKNHSSNGSILTFPYYSATALPENRFVNNASSGATQIAAEGSITFLLAVAAGPWFLLAHEQGAWITPPFSAADYGGWAVAAGQVTLARYRLSGRTLQWSLYISGASLASPAAVSRSIFGGFTTPPAAYFAFVHSVSDSAGATAGFGQHTSVITFYRDTNAASINAGTVSLNCTAMVEVV
jgi:hypothetical protein